jgi:hypothetical protein
MMKAVRASLARAESRFMMKLSAVSSTPVFVRSPPTKNPAVAGFFVQPSPRRHFITNAAFHLESAKTPIHR